RDRSKLGPWLITVAGRLAHRQFQRAKRQAANQIASGKGLEHSRDPEALPDERAAASDEAARLRTVMADLPVRCRDLLGYLFLDPGAPTYTEIAHLLGVSVDSIGPLRGRCLEQLRDLVEQLNYK